MNAELDWNMDDVRSAYEKQDRTRREAKRVARAAQGKTETPSMVDDADYRNVAEVHSNHVIVRKGYGDSRAHLKVPYDVQKDGSVKFGAETPVEQVYVPAKKKADLSRSVKLVDPIDLAVLNAKKRKALKPSQFALGEDKYPIPDEAHARNAISRVMQNGTPAQQAIVKAAVRRKFPQIKVS